MGDVEADVYMFFGKRGDVIQDGHVFCNVQENIYMFSKDIYTNTRSPRQQIIPL